MTGQPRFLTATDVAKTKHVSVRSVYDAVYTGRLPAIKVPASGGKRTYYLIQPKAAKAWVPSGGRHRKPKPKPTDARGAWRWTEAEIEAVVMRVLERWTANKS